MNRIGGAVAELGGAMLRLMPAESAHRATIAFLRHGLLPGRAPADDPRLAAGAFGLQFPNPIGMAAGFDKDAEVPEALPRLGFGFVECGTVTPRPQPGNPKPRLFRLKADGAVINRMGFNNRGMEAMAERLSRRSKGGIVGVNIGANKDSPDRAGDYRAAFARLAPLADYVTINVSSPNTPGLRNLQEREALQNLLEGVAGERARLRGRTPILLKIAPDMTDEAAAEIADAAIQAGIEGIVATNTTLARPPGLKSPNASQSGGLSGKPLFARSTEILRVLRRHAGNKLTLIGVGGIGSGADAYAKIRAGADLVQLYTALALHGPGLIGRIKAELLDLLARDGFSSISEAVGADLTRSS